MNSNGTKQIKCSKEKFGFEKQPNGPVCYFPSLFKVNFVLYSYRHSLTILSYFF